MFDNFVTVFINRYEYIFVIFTAYYIIVESIHVGRYSFLIGSKPTFLYLSIRHFTNFLVFIVFTFSLLFVPSKLPKNLLISKGLDYYNLLWIIIILFILQAFRSVLDGQEEKYAKGYEKPNYYINNNLFGWFKNIVIFTGVYSSITHSNEKWFLVSGFLLIGFIIISVIKFRVYDDFFLRSLGSGGSYVGPISAQNITLSQLLFNIVARSYFLVVTSFACAYLLLIKAGSYSGIFYIDEAKASKNIFMDFFYFSIVTLSTVGYGDITPIDSFAKILCSFEIYLGYLLFTLVVSIVISNIAKR